MSQQNLPIAELFPGPSILPLMGALGRSRAGHPSCALVFSSVHRAWELPRPESMSNLAGSGHGGRAGPHILGPGDIRVH